MDQAGQNQLIFEVGLGHTLILGGMIGFAVVLGFTILAGILWLAMSRIASALRMLGSEIRTARAEQSAVAESIRSSNSGVRECLSELRGWLQAMPRTG